MTQPGAPVCRGLGALVAEKFAAQGCNLAINYVSNLERAEQTAKKIEKEYKAKAVIIQGVRAHVPSVCSMSSNQGPIYSAGCRRASRLRENRSREYRWAGGVGYHHLECCERDTFLTSLNQPFC